MNILKKMAMSFSLVTLALFAGTALACDAGNQCFNGTPDLLSQTSMSGGIDSLGFAQSTADGVGTESISAAFTSTQGESFIDMSSSLINDKAVDCTDCGDNRHSIKMSGWQRTVSGAENFSSGSNSGPVSSASAASNWSGMSGQATTGSFSAR